MNLPFSVVYNVHDLAMIDTWPWFLGAGRRPNHLPSLQPISFMLVTKDQPSPSTKTTNIRLSIRMWRGIHCRIHPTRASTNQEKGASYLIQTLWTTKRIWDLVLRALKFRLPSMMLPLCSLGDPACEGILIWELSSRPFLLVETPDAIAHGCPSWRAGRRARPFLGSPDVQPTCSLELLSWRRPRRRWFYRLRLLKPNDTLSPSPSTGGFQLIVSSDHRERS